VTHTLFYIKLHARELRTMSETTIETTRTMTDSNNNSEDDNRNHRYIELIAMS
jgi:hypothetical protein